MRDNHWDRRQQPIRLGFGGRRYELKGGVAAAILLPLFAAAITSCATTATYPSRIEGIDTHLGTTVAELSEQLGAPDFRRDYGEGGLLLGYRVHTHPKRTEIRCSVIYTVQDDRVVEVHPVGMDCKEGIRSPGTLKKVTDRAKG